MDTYQIITIVSAFLAGLSFIGFALPMLNRAEQKERFRAVVNKKRRDLLEQVKTKPKAGMDVKAKDNMAALFKMQKLAGDIGDKIRVKMLQAGYRSPKAPLVFLSLRIALPVLFALLAMFFLGNIEKPLPDAIAAMIIISVAIAGSYLPGLLLKNQIMKRQQEMALSFPDTIDMILICVQGGVGIEQAIARIAEEISEHSKVLAEEMGILSAELSMLNDRKKAFQDFSARVGTGAAKSFCTAMIQAEQYGTSISQAMRVLAEDLRDQRMAEAERKAASLPPKLTVPMILFFLPALFIVILGPAGIQAAMLR